MTAYGKAIKIIRQKQGMTLIELARRSGVSQGCISRYENGKSDLTMKSMTKMMRALGYEIVLKPRHERKYTE